MAGGYIVPDRSNYPIPLKHIDTALQRAPFRSTTVLQDLRGPSHIYAILMDSRIRPAWDHGVLSRRHAWPRPTPLLAAAYTPSARGLSAISRFLRSGLAHAAST